MEPWSARSGQVHHVIENRACVVCQGQDAPVDRSEGASSTLALAMLMHPVLLCSILILSFALQYTRSRLPASSAICANSLGAGQLWQHANGARTSNPEPGALSYIDFAINRRTHPKLHLTNGSSQYCGCDPTIWQCSHGKRVS